MKIFINAFLKDLAFKSIYLHLESIVACYGATVSSACVVDIGAETLNICCVDEGLIV